MYLVISATNRKNSTTLEVARFYQKLLQQQQIEAEVLDLCELPSDFISSALYENQGKNEVFNRMQEKVWKAEKIIFVLPEYNGGFPGILKVFIDALKYPDSLTNKKGALVGISDGVQGAAVPLSHLTDVLNHLNMHVFGLKVKMGNINQFFKEGVMTDPTYQKFIDKQINGFIQF
jgi:NAD(P)H-dependent FMN reductase